ncbi:MAG TPA: hypothetical protein VFV34_18070 [Blastocatellia bacterium]|nr:hypothetical protein [Blastocatellia bacterium]
MKTKSPSALSLIAATALLAACVAAGVTAQDSATQDQQDKQKALEKKALQLLEQTISEAQFLRLPENRIRIQITAGDLLWDRDPSRARTLLTQAAIGIAEMIHSSEGSDRQNNAAQTASQLRQQLILAAATHDPTLAYEFLNSTRQDRTAQNQRGFRGQDPDTGLEMQLLALIAASDPKLALKNASATLDKGQFPRTLARVAAQLQQSDKDAGAKLVDKIVGRLTSDTLLSSFDAGVLALELLRPGPRPASTSDQQPVNSAASGQVLDDSTYRSLLETVINTAMTATPRPNTAPQGPAAARGRQGGGAPGPGGQPVQGGSAGGGVQAARAPVPDTQANARSLLMNLQSLMPQIDKYLPLRAAALRQKLTDISGGANQRQNFGQFADLMQSGSVDAIVQAAPNAPAAFQSRMYEQAAMKAASSGDPDKARQIANEHLEQAQRDRVNQEIDRQQTLRAALAGKLSDAQQLLSAMKSDRERVNWLTQMAGTAGQKGDSKLALQFLQEARNLVSRRAENYQQLESQLQVAHAYAAFDIQASFEILESTIDQLNDLLNAAVLLNGFEVRVFRDGELPIQASSGLSNMVIRCAQELSALAQVDFARTQNTADRFQRPEPRVAAHLSIVRVVLRGKSLDPLEPGRLRQTFGFGR